MARSTTVKAVKDDAAKVADKAEATRKANAKAAADQLAREAHENTATEAGRPQPGK